MAVRKPHPRASLNTGGRLIQTATPETQPEHPAAVPPKPIPPRTAKTLLGVSAKMDAEDLAKLDRIRRQLGGFQPATRSAAIRWLIQQAQESHHAPEPDHQGVPGRR